MALSRWAQTRMAEDLGVDFGIAEESALVRAWQEWAGGLGVDGKAGPKTLRALWLRHRPTCDEVVGRARAALQWPAVKYSMTTSAGMGDHWMPASDFGFAAGDCSDFDSHCLGVPKPPAERGAKLWLGADALRGGGDGADGPVTLIEHALDDARPGDMIVYGGSWHRGQRTGVGHVEVCVEVKDGRIWTVGCASSNKPSAVALADKTALWRRKKAVAMRPAWYGE